MRAASDKNSYPDLQLQIQCKKPTIKMERFCHFKGCKIKPVKIFVCFNNIGIFVKNLTLNAYYVLIQPKKCGIVLSFSAQPV